MKLFLTFYVPYGPVGHPEAGPITHLLGNYRDDVEREAYSYLSRNSSQNNVPTVFFDDNISLADNGYFILEVNGDEISDAELFSLPKPKMFVPETASNPGRKLQNFKKNIPSFYHHFDFEVWNEGTAGCDHDFGLESYKNVYKNKWLDTIVTEEESYEMGADDLSYHISVTCSRCGAVHAMEERG